MNQQDLTSGIADTLDDSFTELGEFGDAEHIDKQPFWKRDLVFGYSLPWLLGALLFFVVVCWYLFGSSLPSLFSPTPTVDQFQEVDDRIQRSHSNPQPAVNVNDTASGSASVSPSSDAHPVVMPAETANLMTEIRNELNDRDNKTNATLSSLGSAINKLSEAIKRDEAYALETRNQLMALQQQLATFESRMAGGQNSLEKATAGKQKVSNPVSGMKVMSLENGMAWILWQGSTWAVREGDSLGKITIRRIDPASRSVVTSGGTLH